MRMQSLNYARCIGTTGGESETLCAMMTRLCRTKGCLSSGNLAIYNL